MFDYISGLEIIKTVVVYLPKTSADIIIKLRLGATQQLQKPISVELVTRSLRKEP